MTNTIRILIHGAVLATALACSGSAAAAAPQPKAKIITMEKAESIALERVPGGTIETIERDRELGVLVYEVEVRAPDGREHDITIDATDGRVLSDEIDVD